MYRRHKVAMGASVQEPVSRRNGERDFFFRSVSLLAVVCTSAALEHDFTAPVAIAQGHIQGDVTVVYMKPQPPIERGSIGRGECVLGVESFGFWIEQRSQGFDDSLAQACCRV